MQWAGIVLPLPHIIAMRLEPFPQPLDQSALGGFQAQYFVAPVDEHTPSTGAATSRELRATVGGLGPDPHQSDNWRQPRNQPGGVFVFRLSSAAGELASGN